MSVSANGSGYTRWPDVDAEIEAISKCPRPEWRRRAKQLRSETLVCLIGQIRNDNGEIAGALQMELSRRTMRIANPVAQGFDPTTQELIVTEVESEIRELVLSERPSTQREFLEVAFAVAVRARTVDVIRKHKMKPLGGLRSDVSLHTDAEKVAMEVEEIEAVEELASSDFEDEQIRAEFVQHLYSMVDDPRCAEALMLVYGLGYSYAEAAQGLGLTERQIEHLLVKGKRTIQEKLGVEK
jgi:RNA polymerase sigma factor (sigma-70 family)